MIVDATKKRKRKKAISMGGKGAPVQRGVPNVLVKGAWALCWVIFVSLYFYLVVVHVV